MADDLLKELNSALDEKDTTGQVQAINTLFERKSLKMKSHMRTSVNEAHYFAKLFVLADVLQIKTLKSYCNEEVELRVSNDRLGRKETVEISRSHPPEQKRPNFFGRMLGL